MIIKTYNQSEVTWEIASKASLIFNDSFRSDFLRKEYYSEQYDFSKLPILPEHALMQIKPFSIAVDHFARVIYYQAQTNPRFYVFLARDEESDQCIGMATILLPDYLPVVSQSHRLWIRCKSIFLSIWFWIQDRWAFKSFSNPLLPAPMASEFIEGSRKCNALATPERLAELSKMNYSQLEQSAYPKSLGIYLNLFAIIAAYQGRGLGKPFLDFIIQKLPELTVIKGPPQFNGPPKIQLFSSPKGIGFYKRYGFTLASQYMSLQPSGRDLAHSYFFKNLHPSN